MQRTYNQLAASLDNPGCSEAWDSIRGVRRIAGHRADARADPALAVRFIPRDDGADHLRAGHVAGPEHDIV